MANSPVDNPEEEIVDVLPFITRSILVALGQLNSLVLQVFLESDEQHVQENIVPSLIQMNQQLFIVLQTMNELIGDELELDIDPEANGKGDPDIVGDITPGGLLDATGHAIVQPSPELPSDASEAQDNEDNAEETKGSETMPSRD